VDIKLYNILDADIGNIMQITLLTIEKYWYNRICERTRMEASMKGTYEISRYENNLEITIKHRAYFGHIVSKVFLLLFYMTIVLATLYYIYRPILVDYYLYWLIPCVAIILVCIANMIWCCKGVEKIVITNKTWVIEKCTLGVKSIKEYDILKIENLRLADGSDKKSSQLLNLIIYLKRKVCFDYNNRCVYFADALSIADADQLIEEIEKAQVNLIRHTEIK